MKFKAGDRFVRYNQSEFDYFSRKGQASGEIFAICYHVRYANGARAYPRIGNFDQEFELVSAAPKFKAGDLIGKECDRTSLRKIEEVAVAKDTYWLSFLLDLDKRSVYDDIEYIDSSYRKIGRAE